MLMVIVMVLSVKKTVKISSSSGFIWFLWMQKNPELVLDLNQDIYGYVSRVAAIFFYSVEPRARLISYNRYFLTDTDNHNIKPKPIINIGIYL